MAKPKEVDLLDILVYFLNFFKKKWKVVLLVFVLCLGIPAGYYNVKSPKYTSSIVITTNTIDYTMVEQLSEPLTQAISYDKVEIVSELMNIPRENAIKLDFMQLKEVTPHPAERKDGCTFSIEIISLDASTYPLLKDPLLNYFNNNSFIRKITDVRLQSLEALNAETAMQIARLDSVQKTIPMAISKYASEKTNLSDLNLGFLYQEMLALKLSETDTQEEIDLIEEFKSITDFTIVTERRSVLFYLGFGFIGAISITVLLMLLSGIGNLLEQKRSQSEA